MQEKYLIYAISKAVKRPNVMHEVPTTVNPILYVFSPILLRIILLSTSAAHVAAVSLKEI